MWRDLDGEGTHGPSGRVPIVIGFQSGRRRSASVGALAGHYRERTMATGLFTVDAGAAAGHPVNSGLRG